MNRPPNILFLLSDEHRADVAGFAGNDVVRTPNLDRLASTGVVFTNAYTPSPICVPARQCIASGQLPSTNRCRGWVDLPPNHMTFARQFSRHAYETICCGKLHHLGPDQMQGWNQRPAGDVHVATGHIDQRDEELFKAYERPFGDYKWSDTKEVLRAGVGRSHIIEKDELWTAAALDSADWHFSSAQYDREQPQRPLMMMLSLIAPHYPYQIDTERFGYYLNRVEPYLDQQVSDHPFLSKRQVRPGIDCNVRDLRRATAAYYGMIEHIDHQYGRLLERLEYNGQDLDDWIILYTSDHGEMLGEHGIWEKQKFYEGSCRVPLVIRWPKGFEGARTVDQNVNLCDLFATLCDLCGIAIPDGLDSRSLAPLLRGEDCAWDNVTVSEFGPDNLMIKRDALKYQWYGPDMPEVLFDLVADPDELHNVIDAPQHAEQLATMRMTRQKLRA